MLQRLKLRLDDRKARPRGGIPCKLRKCFDGFAYFSRAILGLMDMGKVDQAAVLCRKAPVSGRLSFQVLLKDLGEAHGIALAVACMRREDWSTSLRILDWALARSQNARTHGKILTATEKIARHILRQDPETLHAKVVTLQLSPTLSEHVLAAARLAG